MTQEVMGRIGQLKKEFNHQLIDSRWDQELRTEGDICHQKMVFGLTSTELGKTKVNIGTLEALQTQTSFQVSSLIERKYWREHEVDKH